MIHQERTENMNDVQIPHSNWEVIERGPKWMENFRSFQQSAFRLELLQAYDAPSEKEAFEAFRKGEEVSGKRMQNWCELIEEHKKEGRLMSRIHVVDLPLSTYLEFEVQCAYKYSLEAGEDILIIDRASLSPAQRKILREDFWLFDDSKVMVQDYSDSGELLAARISQDSEIVKEYIEIRDSLLKVANPLKDFYREVAGRSL